MRRRAAWRCCRLNEERAIQARVRVCGRWHTCLRMYNIDAGRSCGGDIKRMRCPPLKIDEYGLREGDLLVNRVNSRELVGKAAFIPPTLEPSVFESKNIRVRLDGSKVLPKFLNYQLLAWQPALFREQCAASCGMASISQKQLADFPIVLADLTSSARSSPNSKSSSPASTKPSPTSNASRLTSSATKPPSSKAPSKAVSVPTEAELASREGRNFESASTHILRTTPPPRPNRFSTRSTDLIPGHAALSVGNLGSSLPAGWAWVPLGKL